MYTSLHAKYPILLSNFNEKGIFSTDFRKIPKYQISWKFVQWLQSCSMRTDRLDEAKSLFTVLRIRLRSRQGSRNFVKIDEVKSTLYSGRKLISTLDFQIYWSIWEKLSMGDLRVNDVGQRRISWKSTQRNPYLKVHI
jgi:hypothetical protein